ncbi:hypothetical protein AAC387_Pa11g2035 [Persea americana]
MIRIVLQNRKSQRNRTGWVFLVVGLQQQRILISGSIFAGKTGQIDSSIAAWRLRKSGGEPSPEMTFDCRTSRSRGPISIVAETNPLEKQRRGAVFGVEERRCRGRSATSPKIRIGE